MPKWQSRLWRPARRARHSPSASASPSRALSSRAVGRALPPAGEQRVSPRRARHTPRDTRTKPHSLRPPRSSPPSRPPGPLSWLPPAPGLSQFGGAQPRSQWQCPWLLHTWVGGTGPAQPLRGSSSVPAPAAQPRTHPVPVAFALALLLAQHRDVLAAVLEAHLGDMGVSALGDHPAPSLLALCSPSRGHRRCQAAPWPHQSHPRPQRGESPGRTLLACRHAGTAASHSWCPCRDRGVRAGGTARGTRRRTGASLTAGHRRCRSRWGAARSAHVHPLSCSEQPRRSWGQDWHLQRGQRRSAPLPSPQHPSPALLYLAPGADGTAPRRWHRPRCGSVPARQHRAAHPAGTSPGGSVERPRHRTRAGHTRPGAPGTRGQHGAAVGTRGHCQIDGVARVALTNPRHGRPSPRTWQSWQQESPVAHAAPGISWQELLLQQGSVHSWSGMGCGQHWALEPAPTAPETPESHGEKGI